MCLPLPRRMALLGAGVLLALPARAADDTARLDAAFQVLATGSPPELDRTSAMLQPWLAGPRPGLWIAAAVTGGASPGVLRAALLEEGDSRRALASGEAGIVMDQPPWSISLDRAPGRWPQPGGPIAGIRLVNRYTSTLRSSDSTAIHLFRWQGAVLQPVFAGLVRRSAYERDGSDGCIERRGYGQLEHGGRQAPDTVRKACDAGNETSAPWAISTGPGRSGGVPDLVVRDGRNRVVSRHRWTGMTYAPPRFDPQ